MTLAAQKNEDLAERLLGRRAVAGTLDRFKSFKVDVCLEDTPSPNALDACSVALRLLPRTLKFVRYRGPERALEEFPESYRRRLDPKGMQGADATVVFGPRKIPGAPRPLYAGSSGWSSYLSASGPCPWVPAVPNALGAMHAGALASGEIFKMLVPGARPKPVATLAYDLVTHGRAKQPVAHPAVPGGVDLGDLAIVGCGAIGQVLCYALAGAARLEGLITLIDGDVLDESNEQRYLTAFEETRSVPKTRRAGEVLSANSPQLRVDEVPEAYEAYAAPREVRFPEMAVCVDNEWTRVNVQGALPRTLWNGWTDVEAGRLRYGASRHSLDGGSACLACYYRPAKSPSGEDMDVARTGLDRAKIRRAHEQNKPLDLVSIRTMARKKRIPLRQIRHLATKPPEEQLHGRCGAYYPRPGEGGAPTPAPHQPALAGILLAAQLVLERIAPGASALESLSDFDALRAPGPLCLFESERHPGCFCGDPAYRRAYAQKWEAYSGGR